MECGAELEESATSCSKCGCPVEKIDSNVIGELLPQKIKKSTRGIGRYL